MAKPKRTKPSTSSKPRKSGRSARAESAKTPLPPPLLSGGNPQIPKGYGEAPVKAYLAAMPGWKRGVGRKLDAMISQCVPGVRKAVKWNSPLYGVGEGDVWFLSFHCFERYVKVAFFRGASLDPPPPGASKQREVRYLDVYEGWRESSGTQIDDAQLSAWITQASRLPGEKM